MHVLKVHEICIPGGAFEVRYDQDTIHHRYMYITQYLFGFTQAQWQVSGALLQWPYWSRHVPIAMRRLTMSTYDVHAMTDDVGMTIGDVST